MNTSPTGSITDKLYAVRTGIVNFYAYKTDSSVILFDTGINPALASNGLRRLGISPDNVKYVFLTHSDYDHAGGINAFPNAVCYLPESEEQMINGKTARRFILRNGRFGKYHIIDDNSEIQIEGVKIKLFLNPGHTAGSTSYLLDGRILVTGDLLRVTRDGKIAPFLWLMNMNHKEDSQSLENMKDVISQAEYVLTGHSGFKKLEIT
jgi:glyoxylase-like metal-dependent hydrolase (beta-lactamase superfamily II)